jgi:hypothetical protein
MRRGDASRPSWVVWLVCREGCKLELQKLEINICLHELTLLLLLLLLLLFLELALGCDTMRV